MSKKDIFGGGKASIHVSSNAERVAAVMKQLGPEVGIKAKRKFMRAASYWLRDRMKEDAPIKTGATKASIGAKEKGVGDKNAAKGFNDYTWWIGVRRDYVKPTALAKIGVRNIKQEDIYRNKKKKLRIDKKPYQYAWLVNKFSKNTSKGWFDASIRKNRGKAFQIFYWGMTGLVTSTMAKAK